MVRWKSSNPHAPFASEASQSRNRNALLFASVNAVDVGSSPRLPERPFIAGVGVSTALTRT